MGSNTKTAKISKQKVLQKHRKKLDGLTTREAQVIRMLHSVPEPQDAEVGSPSDDMPGQLRQRLMDVEAEIFERIRNASRNTNPKSNIVNKLKNDA